MPYASYRHVLLNHYAHLMTTTVLVLAEETEWLELLKLIFLFFILFILFTSTRMSSNTLTLKPIISPEHTVQAIIKASGVPYNSLKVHLIPVILMTHDSRLDLFQKCKDWILGFWPSPRHWHQSQTYHFAFGRRPAARERGWGGQQRGRALRGRLTGG